MRDKNGRFIKGYKPVWSAESRRKVSESMKGVNTWSRGRTLTAEHKEKCRKNSARYWLGKKRLNMSGRLHPNWKEIKLSPLKLAIRDSFKYKSWRMDILKRDSFRCRGCNKTNHLQADHYPVRFSDLLKKFEIDSFDKAMACEELWKLDIARTLCNKCHRKTATWGNKIKANLQG